MAGNGYQLMEIRFFEGASTFGAGGNVSQALALGSGLPFPSEGERIPRTKLSRVEPMNRSAKRDRRCTGETPVPLPLHGAGMKGDGQDATQASKLFFTAR